MQGNDKSNWSGYTSILGRISRLQEVTLKIRSKHLLPQLMVREFEQEQEQASKAA